MSDYIYDVLGLVGWAMLGGSIYVELGPLAGVGYLGGTIMVVAIALAWNDSK